MARRDASRKDAILIYPDDAKEFAGIMDIVWQSLGRNAVDKTTKQYWFSKLQHLPMGEVSGLFDKWLMTEKELPTVNDILHMAKPREFHKALPAPRSEEVVKAGLDRISQAVSNGLKHKKDMKAWARKILDTPANYPDIAIRFAKEALEKAVRMGRISQDHAQSLLPAPKNSALEAVMPQLKMLTANEKLSEEDRLKSKAKMAEIKAMLMGRQA